MRTFTKAFGIGLLGMIILPVFAQNSAPKNAVNSADSAKLTVSDTAAVKPAMVVADSPAEYSSMDSSEGITANGYHYDFYDKELSQYAVATLAKQAKRARVILAGENHRFVKFNSKSEYLWMKLLYEEAGYRNYVIELSPTRALFFERYICKGDTMARNFVRATSSARYMRLFDSLAVWQQSLPEAERIHIYGLDVERFPDMTVMWLNDVVARRLATTPAPASIHMGVEAIKTLGSNYYYGGLQDYAESLESLKEEEEESKMEVDSTVAESASAVGIDTLVALEVKEPVKLADWKKLDSELFSFDETPAIAELYKFLDSNVAEMKKWLGPLYEEYNQAFAHLREVHYWEERDNTAQQFQWREEEMYRRFTILLDKYPNAKFFGQFGRCHVALSKQQQDCGWFEYSSLVNKLRTRYFKNDTSVLNVGIFYWDHKDRTDDISSIDLMKNDQIQEEVDALYEASSGNTMMFDLVNANKQIVELRKKFAFVVVTGSDYSENDDDEDDDSYYEGGSSENQKPILMNMGIQVAFFDGLSSTQNTGFRSMVDYLLINGGYNNILLPNRFMPGMSLGYTSNHISLLLSSSVASKKVLKAESSFGEAPQIVTWKSLHSAQVQFHTGNRFNTSKSMLRLGLGIGMSYMRQGMEAQLYQSGTALKDNTVLVNRYWAPQTSATLGIMKNNVGLDLEIGYRLAPGESEWKFVTGNSFIYNSNGMALAEHNLSGMFTQINLRFIIPNTQPVSKGYLQSLEGEDADSVAVDYASSVGRKGVSQK